MQYDALFRVEAGSDTGLGHLRRCLALANGMKTCGLKKIAFLSRAVKNVTEWTGREFTVYEIHSKTLNGEAKEWRKIVSDLSPRMTVIDWYGGTVHFLESLHAFVPNLICVDDNAVLERYPVDGVINHNVYAGELKYRASEKTRFFLGPKYTLIGKEFLKLKPKRWKPRVPARLLVSLGGFTSHSDFLKISRAIRKIGKKIDVFWANGRVKSIGSKMQKADFAVSASGTTSYELAYLGIPTLLVILAENQVRIARAFHKRRAALNLGWYRNLSPVTIGKALSHLLVNPKICEQMSQRAHAVVDGCGAVRLSKDLIRTYIKGRN